MAKKPETANLPTMLDPTQVALPPGLKGKSIGKRVTVPLWSLTHNGPIAFLVEGEISAQNSALATEGKDKPMSVVPIINLETGESLCLICPTVLESALRRTPGGYVGKEFYALQGPKMPGKRYFQIELFTVK